jgi:rSAM/selenodomain-associated transferase 2
MARVPSHELSVIVPVLNEADALPSLLEQLRAQKNVALEILVADGGSSDASVARAEAAGARVVRAPRGRGKQMNAAAALARGEYLLFLHADSSLTSPVQLRDALAALRTESLRDARVAGHFPLRFVRSVAGHDFFYRHLEEKTTIQREGTINGDQGALLSAAYFRELGGFDERLPFLEDQRLAARIFAGGRWILLPGVLHTSARRFETEGVYRRYTLMAIIMGMHAAGVEEFFRRAPKVYVDQNAAAGLPVLPYLVIVRDILREAGPAGALRISLRCGHYVRSNSWQLFFPLDVCLRGVLGPGRAPFLRFHDRVIRPLTDHALGDAIIGALVVVWFMGVLPLGYAIVERLGGRSAGG